MWSCCETVPSDDETLNSAFCTNALFKISSAAQVTHKPSVTGTLQNRRLIISIDSVLVLFQDENRYNDGNFIDLGHTIEALAISEDGDFTICGLADGSIIVLHVKGVNVFGGSIDPADRSESKTFAGIQRFNGGYLLQTVSGAVYQLELDEARVQELLEEPEMNQDCTLDFDGCVSVKRISGRHFRERIQCFVPQVDCQALDSNAAIRLISASSESIFFQNQKMVIKPEYNGVKKIYDLVHCYVALSNSGQLFEICPMTYLAHELPLPYKIEEMMVMECSAEMVELLILTKADDKGARRMKTVEFPSMKCTYELDMIENIWLIQQPKNSANIYYISGNTLDQPTVQEVEVKILSETQPALRLENLIRKGRLDEAEEFAKQFELSVQPVHQARVRLLLAAMSASMFETADETDKTFASVMETLACIEDVAFFASLRRASIPDRNKKQLLLEFLLGKVEPSSRASTEINEQLLRIETLYLIDPYECDMEWETFVYHPDLTALCMQLFKTDMASACVIWSRHASSIIPHLDEEKIDHSLKSVPAGTPPLELIQWLMHFVPPILQHFPHTMRKLVLFVIGKTKALQFMQYWPKVGLTFIDDVIGIFRDVHFPIADIRLQYDTNMAEMQRLSEALGDLSYLREHFGLDINIEHYLSESKESVGFRLLTMVPLQNLRRLVTDFLYKQFVGEEEAMHDTITLYIDYLIKHQNMHAWDERSVLLLDVLHNEEQKLMQVLSILRASPVPWSAAIAPLIKYAHSDNPIARLILIEQKTQVVKIIKVKYGWQATSTENLMLLVRRVMKVRGSDMLNDIKELTNTEPQIAYSANLHVVQKLAETGDFASVSKFIESLSEERKIDCCHGVIEMVTQMLNDGCIPGEHLEPYVELLHLVKFRSDSEHQYDIQQILNILQLRSEFNLVVTREMLTDHSTKATLLKNGIVYLLSKISNDRQKFIPVLLGAMRRLSTYLQCDFLESLYEVMLKLNNVHLSCTLAVRIFEMIEFSSSVAHENIYRIVALLLIQQIAYFETAHNDWELDPLVFPVASQLLYKCHNESTCHATIKHELLRWIHVGTLYYFVDVEAEYQHRSVLSEKVFRLMFQHPTLLNGHVTGESNKRDSLSAFDVVNVEAESVAIVSKKVDDQEAIIKCVGLALQMIVQKSNAETLEQPYRHLLQLIRTHSSHTEFIELDFQRALEELIKLKKYSEAVSIVNLMLSYRKQTGPLFPKDYVDTLKKKSLKYFLSQREPNYSKAILVLFSCENRDTCLEYLRSNLNNESQRVAFHTLLEFYYMNVGQMDKAVAERSHRMRFSLYQELCRIDPTMKHKKSLVFDSFVELIREMKTKVLSIDLLRKMSDIFAWDYQQMLITQVTSILSMQTLDFSVQQDSFGMEEVLVSNSVEQMLKQCQPYLHEIENSVLLRTTLAKYMEEANFYFYEIYLCAIEIFKQIGQLSDELKHWKTILNYLKTELTTKRKHRPGQQETDAWLRLQPDGGMLPQISKYRYPFTLLVRQPLKLLLKEEICIENYKKLLALIEMKATLENLDLMEAQDYFCKSAVINSIAEYKLQAEDKQGPATAGWHLHPVNNAFLQSILRVVECVSDLSSKLFILYYVTCNAPEGADQVEAALECYNFAQDHMDELSANAEAKDKVEKIMRKYPIFKTQHLLLQYGITDDKILQLVKNPPELINALYNDAINRKIDINALANEIAKLHQLDIDAIHMTLIQKWLTILGSGGETNGMLEETLYEDHNMSVDDSETEDDASDYVARAHYILKMWDKERSIQYLVSQLCTGENSIDTKRQLQIYECFSKLVDDKYQSYTNVISTARYTSLKCTYMLKTLGFSNLPLSKFEEMDKMALLKRLWQSYATNAKGLETMAFICLGYDIFVPQIWNGILKQMARSGMVPQLHTLLDVVTAKEQLLSLEGLRLAWETVIKAPFRSASRVKSFEEDTTLAKSLVMLQKCPISYKLNLLEIADLCINANRLYMAAVLIGFARGEQKQELKRLIVNNKVMNLKEQIIDLEEFGLATSITKAVCGELGL